MWESFTKKRKKKESLSIPHQRVIPLDTSSLFLFSCFLSYRRRRGAGRRGVRAAAPPLLCALVFSCFHHIFRIVTLCMRNINSKKKKENKERKKKEHNIHTSVVFLPVPFFFSCFYPVSSFFRSFCYCSFAFNFSLTFVFAFMDFHLILSHLPE